MIDRDVEPVLQHPVLRCASVITDALRDVRNVPVELLGTREKAAALLELAAAESQLAALRLRVLAAASDVAADDGARDVAAWLAHRTRTDGAPRRRDLRLGQALADRWTEVGAALSGGRVNEAQAAVIVSALDAIDEAEVPAEVFARAQTHLVELAARFAPMQLRVLGRRILDLVAPEVGEEQEAKALETEEARARETATLFMSDLGDGRTRIEATVPTAVGVRLKTYLEAYTSPRREALTGQGGHLGQDGRVVPAYRRRGQAFCTLLELLDPQKLPRHGGDATAVFVTTTLDALRADLGVAGLLGADDEPISASEARRLACNADIIPVVLGSRSEVLDLGRSARLFSSAQRKAMALRDKRCRAEGCTIPAAWCEAHHLDPWSRGGRTDLDDGILYCAFHHHCAHDRRYEVTQLPDGDRRFRRRRC